jgi:AraC-like DNA-binding protein
MPSDTAFLENLHYVPDANWTPNAFTVLRAGKVAAGPKYGVRRASQVGQDVLFCLSGTGVVELADLRIEVQPGQLVWIPNEQPHAHVADRDMPWTLLWFRFDGPNPVAIRAKLFGETASRTTIGDIAALTAWFERLFAVLRGRALDLDLRLNLLVSKFFLLVDQSQSRPAPGGASDPLVAVLAAMRADIGRPWSTNDITSLTRLSPSQTRRLFQKHTRESPRRWLIRERLIAAQTLMMRDDVPLAIVAEACGFCDVYHFGREFKRVVGTSPAMWRRTELGGRSAARKRLQQSDCDEA